MSTINEEVFNEALEEAEKVGGGGGDNSLFRTVTKANIRWGYCVYSKPPTMFPHKFRNGEDQQRAFEEASKLQAELGKKGKPTYGFITIMYGDDRPQHKDGKLDFDPQEFVALWQTEENVTLNDAEKELRGNAPMPSSAVKNGIKQNNAYGLFGDEPVWCLMNQVVDGFQAAKGRRKTDKNDPTKNWPYRIHVVEKVFANEAEAKAYAKELSEGHEGGLSAFAQSQTNGGGGWTLADWRDDPQVAAGVQQSLELAKAGKNEAGNKIGPALSGEEAMKVVAKQFGVEVSDLQLLDIELPF